MAVYNHTERRNHIPRVVNGSLMSEQREQLKRSVEHRLLTSCATTERDQSRILAIGRIIGEGVRWDSFIYESNRHKVTPLVFQSLKQLCPTYVPSPYLEILEKQYRANVAKNLFLLTSLIEITQALSNRGIVSLSFKGPSLAYLAYQDIGLRQFSDLDIIVRRDDYDAARRFLQETGYRLVAEYEWESTLVHYGTMVRVDLHFSFTPVQFPFRFSLEEIRSRQAPLSIAGSTLDLVSPEDMLLLLCVQLAKDCWGCREHPIRLAMVCDIAELLRHHPELDWAWTVEHSRRAGCHRILLVGLSVAQLMLAAPVPAELRRGAECCKMDRLVGETVHRLTASHTEKPERMSADDFHFAIRERWREKLYPAIYEVTKRIPPNDKDYAFLALPKSMRALYYAIRPIRLIRDHVIALVRSAGVRVKDALRRR